MLPPAKTCVICGEDCSGRPRIKDRSGRYACRACDEQARDRAQDAAAIGELLGPPLADSPPRLPRVLGAFATAKKGVRDLFRSGKGP